MGERELLTVKQVAADLNLSVMSVRRYIEDGRLSTYRPGREIFVWSDELERFKATRKPPGRPRRPADPTHSTR
jgi:excisionase family DNA binding protein